MTDFADNATVRLQLRGTPYPAISLNGFETQIPRGSGVEVSGEDAKAMLEQAEEKPEVPHEAIDVTVVDEGESPAPGASLIEAIGEATAENIAQETGETTLEGARSLSDEELGAVSGVGPSTIENKIREQAEDEPEQSESTGEEPEPDASGGEDADAEEEE